MSKELLDEVRTIKMMCVVNFIELQEIRRRLDIAEQTKEDRYEYANNTREYVEALDQKLRRVFKDDLPQLWEQTVGKSEG